MEKLFSRENILIRGTMPGDIYCGFEEAADLLGSGWLYLPLRAERRQGYL